MANLGVGGGPLDLSKAAAAQGARQAQEQAAQARVDDLRRELTKNRDRSFGEVATDTALGVGSGLLGLGQAAYGLQNLMTGGLLDRGLGLADNFQDWQSSIRGAQSDTLRYNRQDANAAFDDSVWSGIKAYATNPALLGDLAAQTAPSLIPVGLAGSVAARTAGAVASREAAQQATRRAVLGTTAAQVGGATNVDAINTIAAQGGDESAQQLGGLGAGVLAGTAAPLVAMGTGAGALESAVASRLGGVGAQGTGSGVANVARGTLAGATKEAVDEGIQGTTEQMAINAVAPQSELFDDTARTAALGSIAGFGMGAPMGALTSTGNVRPDEASAADPQASQQQERPEQPAWQDVPRDLFGRQAQWDTVAQQQRQRGETPDFALDMQAAQGAPNQGELDLRVQEALNARGQDGGQQPLDLGNLDMFGVNEQAPVQDAATAEELATLAGADVQSDMFAQSEAQQRVNALTGVGQRGNATPMTVQEERQQQAQRTLDAMQNASRPGSDLRTAIDPEARQAGMTQDDLITEEDEVMAELFTITEGEDGRPRYWEANEDETDFTEIPRGRAVKRAKEVIAERNRAPSDRWKDTLRTDLGLKKQNMRGKDWDAFATAADEAGIQPESEGAAEFLRLQADALGQDEAGATRFAAGLAERYASPGPDQAAGDQNAAAGAFDQDVNQDASQSASGAELTPSARVAMDAEPEANKVDPQREAEVATHQANIEAFQEANQIRNRGRAVREYFQQNIDEAPTPQDLEDSFQSILQTPEFRQLEDTTQNELIERYSARFDAMEPGKFIRTNANDGTLVDTRTQAQREEDAEQGVRSPQRKSRTKKRRQTQTRTPLTQDRAGEIIERARERLTENQEAPFIVHQTVADYRRVNGQVAPPDAAGVFDNDGVHVILGNIETEEQLAEVLAHERGHEGLRGLLGDRLPAVTNRLWANAALRERIKTKMQSESLDRATAAEETLVDMIANGEELNGDVFSKLRSGVTSTVQSLLGVGKYRITDRQVNRLLRDTSAYMRGRPVEGAGGTLAGENLELDEIIGRPDQVTNSPRFSRVYEALNRTVSDTDPARGNHSTFDTAAKESVRASAKMFKNATNSARTGAMWRNGFLGDFVPASQIANLNERLFRNPVELEDGTLTTRNPLTEAVDRTRRKEAAFNDIINHKGKKALGGESFETSIRDTARELHELRQRSDQQADALDALSPMASYYRLWPDRKWEDQPGADYDRLGITEQERRDAFTQIKKLYRQSGSTGQRLFRQQQAIYRDLWQQRIDALETELQRIHPNGIPDSNSMLRAARRELDDAPYSSLQRDGDHLVIVQDADNNVVEYHAFDSETEAKEARMSIGKNLDEGEQATVTRRDENTLLQLGFNQAQLDQMQQVIDAMVPGDTDPALQKTLRDATTEMYLKMLPNTSFAQFSNRRKNRAGFALNGTRAFTNYSLRAARSISGLQHDGEISQRISDMRALARQRRDAGRDTTREMEVINQLERQQRAASEGSFSKAASTLSNLVFLKFMTSPSQLFINSTQTALVAIPRLAAEYTTGAATKHFTAAMDKFARSRGDMLGEHAKNNQVLDANSDRIMQALSDRGVFGFGFVQDMVDASRAETVQMNAKWRRFMDVAGKSMEVSERFNRQVTAYAAIQMELEKQGLQGANLTEDQFESVVDRATRATYDTHFDYSRANKATNMQKPVGRLAFQFWQYRLNMMAMLAKDFRDSFLAGDISAEERTTARRALAFQLGSQLALTGVSGTAIAPLVFGIMGMFDDEDFIDGRTAFMESYPQILSQGLIGGAFGLDTTRIETGTIYPFVGESRYAPNNAKPDETMAYYGTQFLGPWFGVLSDYYKGASEVAAGNLSSGAQAMLPKALGDPLKAMGEANGVRTSDGTRYFQPSALGGFSQALGLRTSDRAAASNRLGAAYQAASNISTAKDNHLSRLVLANAQGDREAYQQAIEEIGEWNREHPDFPIGQQDIGRALSGQQRSQSNADRYGLPLSRNITGSFLDVAGQ